MAKDIFSIKCVSHTLPEGKRLLDSVNLSIERGDCILLSGPSGGGKSTFLRLLVKLDELQSGEIRFLGENISSISPEKLRSRAGLLHQSPLISRGSVRDNLLLPYAFRINQGYPLPSDRELSKYLDRVLLGDLNLDGPAAALSGGQIQRLCIIRTLMLNPEILLLDEPFSALDKESADAVTSLLMEKNSEGVTLMMVSHIVPSVDLSRLIHLELRSGTFTRDTLAGTIGGA